MKRRIVAVLAGEERVVNEVTASEKGTQFGCCHEEGRCEWSCSHMFDGFRIRILLLSNLTVSIATSSALL